MDKEKKITVKREFCKGYDDRGCSSPYRVYYYQDGIKTYRKILPLSITKKSAGLDCEIRFDTPEFVVTLFVEKIQNNWQVQKSDMFFIASNSFDLLDKNFKTEKEKQDFIISFLKEQGYQIQNSKIELTQSDKKILDAVIAKMLKKKAS